MSTPGFSRRVISGIRRQGFGWLARAIGDRLVPPRLALKSAVLTAVTGRSGLEIGGPSRVFEPGRLLPIYNSAARIDNVNFSVRTAWEQDLREGGTFQFHPQRAPGTQRIRDAIALSGIPDRDYDFVISSHCLEHVANPLRALQEWRRVTRRGGHLVLILPNPARTFDHRRPITTLEHLLEDLRRSTGEDDATHLPEILALHDLDRDPWAGSPAAFRERSARNLENRCLHHHVFDLPLMTAALQHAGWEVLGTETARPVHLVAFARNID